MPITRNKNNITAINNQKRNILPMRLQYVFILLLGTLPWVKLSQKKKKKIFS